MLYNNYNKLSSPNMIYKPNVSLVEQMKCLNVNNLKSDKAKFKENYAHPYNDFLYYWVNVFKSSDINSIFKGRLLQISYDVNSKVMI